MYVSPINYNNQLTLVLFVFPCSIDRNSNMEAFIYVSGRLTLGIVIPVLYSQSVT